MYSVTLWVRALRISNEPAGARRDEGHAVVMRGRAPSCVASKGCTFIFFSTVACYHPGEQQVALTRVPDEP